MRRRTLGTPYAVNLQDLSQFAKRISADLQGKTFFRVAEFDLKQRICVTEAQAAEK